MTVVGVDFGNESVVVAVAANRGVDIVLNVASNRATPAYIAFSKRGNRLFGDVARQSHVSHAACTVCNLKRLIGRRYDDPVVQRELAGMTIQCQATPDGFLACIVPVHTRNDAGESTVQDEAFTPVELLAAFLSFVRRDVSKSLRTEVSECVLSCPTFFTQSQRLALLDAARIARWQVMRLFHETTAALVAYSMPRKWEEPHTVAIVDMGHAHLQVSVARIHGAECDVLSYMYDEHVGGRDLDELLVRWTDERHGSTAMVALSSMSPSLQKGRLRVRIECEKVKRVLSSNKDARLSVECVPDVDGSLRDINLPISREQLETRAREILDVIRAKVAAGLELAGVERVDSIELVGGGTRTPCVISCIATAGGREPKRTLDSAECVAKGCAFMAAMLSPRYQARALTVSDMYMYEISLFFDQTVEMIYKANTRLDRTKKIALSIARPIRVRCAYTGHPAITRGECIGECSVEGEAPVASLPGSERRRVQLVVSIDPNGVFRFVTLRPIKSKKDDDVALDVTCRYPGEVGSLEEAIERRIASLCARDAYFDACDDLRNQLAALLYENRGQYGEQAEEDLCRVVEDDTTKLEILKELVQTMRRPVAVATSSGGDGHATTNDEPPRPHGASEQTTPNVPQDHA